jgi:GrpB-like predicted nucleotidyltransferase (UPF0157 family)
MDTNVKLHVFSAGRPEVERMLAIRDWLRTNDADRELCAHQARTGRPRLDVHPELRRHQGGRRQVLFWLR